MSSARRLHSRPRMQPRPIAQNLPPATVMTVRDEDSCLCRGHEGLLGRLAAGVMSSGTRVANHTLRLDRHRGAMPMTIPMSERRLEGRDEPIVDPNIPIVDAQHHLFDRPAMRYMLDDYLADARAGHRI